MKTRSRAVLFGAAALLAVLAAPALGATNPAPLPYIEPVDWLPAWYFATWAVLDTSRPHPVLQPGVPVEVVEPQSLQSGLAAGGSQGRGGGVGVGALAGAAGLHAAMAFPAALGKMPTRPTADGLRRDLLAVRRALGY